MRSSEKMILSMIFLLALGLRFFFAAYVPQQAPDSEAYKNLASSILTEHSYRLGEGFAPEAKRPPLYPLFIAFIYKTFGTEDAYIRYAQALLLSTLPLCIFFICRELNFSTRFSLGVSFLAAFHPELVVPTSFILTEALTVVLFTSSVLLLLLGLRRKNRTYYILAGLFLGLSTLCRPTTLLYPVFLGLAFCFSHHGRKHWKNTLFFIVVAFAVIVPWTTRNYLAFHRFLPIGIGFGDNLWKGSYLPWDGDYNYKDLSDMYKLTKGKDPFEAQDILLSEALKNIRQKPMSYINLCFKKVYRLWCWVPGNKRVLEGKNTLKFLLYMLHLPLLFCFILGCVSSLKNLSPPMLIVLCPLVYFTLFHALLFAIPRYRIPIIPLFLIFAALGLQNLIASLNPKT